MGDDANLERIWSTAEAARKSALRAALRDKLLWGDQSVSLLCCTIKAFCVAMAIATAIGRYGIPEQFSQLFAAFMTMTLVLLNPWSFFWRNVFSERANAAFDAAVQSSAREPANRS